MTEDDIAEVRHDISTLRFELMDVFSRNNFVVPKLEVRNQATGNLILLRVVSTRVSNTPVKCLTVHYIHDIT